MINTEKKIKRIMLRLVSSRRRKIIFGGICMCFLIAFYRIFEIIYFVIKIQKDPLNVYIDSLVLSDENDPEVYLVLTVMNGNVPMETKFEIVTGDIVSVDKENGIMRRLTKFNTDRIFIMKNTNRNKLEMHVNIEDFDVFSVIDALSGGRTIVGEYFMLIRARFCYIPLYFMVHKVLSFNEFYERKKESFDYRKLVNVVTVKTSLVKLDDSSKRVSCIIEIDKRALSLLLKEEDICLNLCLIDINIAPILIYDKETLFKVAQISSNKYISDYYDQFFGITIDILVGVSGICNLLKQISQWKDIRDLNMFGFIYRGARYMSNSEGYLERDVVDVIEENSKVRRSIGYMKLKLNEKYKEINEKINEKNHNEINEEINNENEQNINKTKEIRAEIIHKTRNMINRKINKIEKSINREERNKEKKRVKNEDAGEGEADEKLAGESQDEITKKILRISKDKSGEKSVKKEVKDKKNKKSTKGSQKSSGSGVSESLYRILCQNLYQRFFFGKNKYIGMGKCVEGMNNKNGRKSPESNLFFSDYLIRKAQWVIDECVVSDCELEDKTKTQYNPIDDIIILDEIDPKTNGVVVHICGAIDSEVAKKFGILKMLIDGKRPIIIDIRLPRCSVAKVMISTGMKNEVIDPVWRYQDTWSSGSYFGIFDTHNEKVIKRAPERDFEMLFKIYLVDLLLDCVFNINRYGICLIKVLSCSGIASMFFNHCFVILLDNFSLYYIFEEGFFPLYVSNINNDAKRTIFSFVHKILTKDPMSYICYSSCAVSEKPSDSALVMKLNKFLTMAFTKPKHFNFKIDISDTTLWYDFSSKKFGYNLAIKTSAKFRPISIDLIETSDFYSFFRSFSIIEIRGFINYMMDSSSFFSIMNSAKRGPVSITIMKSFVIEDSFWGPVENARWYDLFEIELGKIFNMTHHSIEENIFLIDILNAETFLYPEEEKKIAKDIMVLNQKEEYKRLANENRFLKEKKLFSNGDLNDGTDKASKNTDNSNFNNKTKCNNAALKKIKIKNPKKMIKIHKESLVDDTDDFFKILPFKIWLEDIRQTNFFSFLIEGQRFDDLTKIQKVFFPETLRNPSQAKGIIIKNTVYIDKLNFMLDFGDLIKDEEKENNTADSVPPTNPPMVIKKVFKKTTLGDKVININAAHIDDLFIPFESKINTTCVKFPKHSTTTKRSYDIFFNSNYSKSKLILKEHYFTKKLINDVIISNNDQIYSNYSKYCNSSNSSKWVYDFTYLNNSVPFTSSIFSFSYKFEEIKDSFKYLNQYVKKFSLFARDNFRIDQSRMNNFNNSENDLYYSVPDQNNLSDIVFDQNNFSTQKRLFEQCGFQKYLDSDKNEINIAIIEHETSFANIIAENHVFSVDIASGKAFVYCSKNSRIHVTLNYYKLLNILSNKKIGFMPTNNMLESLISILVLNKFLYQSKEDNTINSVLSNLNINVNNNDSKMGNNSEVDNSKMGNNSEVDNNDSKSNVNNNDSNSNVNNNDSNSNVNNNDSKSNVDNNDSKSNVNNDNSKSNVNDSKSNVDNNKSNNIDNDNIYMDIDMLLTKKGEASILSGSIDVEAMDGILKLSKYVLLKNVGNLFASVVGVEIGANNKPFSSISIGMSIPSKDENKVPFTRHGGEYRLCYVCEFIISSIISKGMFLSRCFSKDAKNDEIFFNTADDDIIRKNFYKNNISGRNSNDNVAFYDRKTNDLKHSSTCDISNGDDDRSSVTDEGLFNDFEVISDANEKYFDSGYESDEDTYESSDTEDNVDESSNTNKDDSVNNSDIDKNTDNVNNSDIDKNTDNVNNSNIDKNTDNVNNSDTDKNTDNVNNLYFSELNFNLRDLFTDLFGHESVTIKTLRERIWEILQQCRRCSECLQCGMRVRPNDIDIRSYDFAIFNCGMCGSFCNLVPKSKVVMALPVRERAVISFEMIFHELIPSNKITWGLVLNHNTRCFVTQFCNDDFMWYWRKYIEEEELIDSKEDSKEKVLINRMKMFENLVNSKFFDNESKENLGNRENEYASIFNNLDIGMFKYVVADWRNKRYYKDSTRYKENRAAWNAAEDKKELLRHELSCFLSNVFPLDVDLRNVESDGESVDITIFLNSPLIDNAFSNVLSTVLCGGVFRSETPRLILKGRINVPRILCVKFTENMAIRLEAGIVSFSSTYKLKDGCIVKTKKVPKCDLYTKNDSYNNFTNGNFLNFSRFNNLYNGFINNNLFSSSTSSNLPNSIVNNTYNSNSCYVFNPFMNDIINSNLYGTNSVGLYPNPIIKNFSYKHDESVSEESSDLFLREGINVYSPYLESETIRKYLKSIPSASNIIFNNNFRFYVLDYKNVILWDGYYEKYNIILPKKKPIALNCNDKIYEESEIEKKTDDSENDEYVVKNNKYVIKNDEYAIKNDKYAIKNPKDINNNVPDTGFSTLKDTGNKLEDNGFTLNRSQGNNNPDNNDAVKSSNITKEDEEDIYYDANDVIEEDKNYDANNDIDEDVYYDAINCTEDNNICCNSVSINPLINSTSSNTVFENKENISRDLKTLDSKDININRDSKDINTDSKDINRDSKDININTDSKDINSDSKNINTDSKDININTDSKDININTDSKDINTDSKDINRDSKDINRDSKNININRDSKDINTDSKNININRDSKDINTDSKDINTDSKDINTDFKDININTDFMSSLKTRCNNLFNDFIVLKVRSVIYFKSVFNNLLILLLKNLLMLVMSFLKKKKSSNNDNIEFIAHGNIIWYVLHEYINSKLITIFNISLKPIIYLFKSNILNYLINVFKNICKDLGIPHTNVDNNTLMELDNGIYTPLDGMHMLSEEFIGYYVLRNISVADKKRFGCLENCFFCYLNNLPLLVKHFDKVYILMNNILTFMIYTSSDEDVNKIDNYNNSYYSKNSYNTNNSSIYNNNGADDFKTKNIYYYKLQEGVPEKKRKVNSTIKNTDALYGLAMKYMAKHRPGFINCFLAYNRQDFIKKIGGTFLTFSKLLHSKCKWQNECDCKRKLLIFHYFEMLASEPPLKRSVPYIPHCQNHCDLRNALNEKTKKIYTCKCNMTPTRVFAYRKSYNATQIKKNRLFDPNRVITQSSNVDYIKRNEFDRIDVFMTCSNCNKSKDAQNCYKETTKNRTDEDKGSNCNKSKDAQNCYEETTKNRTDEDKGSNCNKSKDAQNCYKETTKNITDEDKNIIDDSPNDASIKFYSTFVNLIENIKKFIQKEDKKADDTQDIQVTDNKEYQNIYWNITPEEMNKENKNDKRIFSSKTCSNCDNIRLNNLKDINNKNIDSSTDKTYDKKAINTNANANANAINSNANANANAINSNANANDNAINSNANANANAINSNANANAINSNANANAKNSNDSAANTNDKNYDKNSANNNANSNANSNANNNANNNANSNANNNANSKKYKGPLLKLRCKFKFKIYRKDFLTATRCYDIVDNYTSNIFLRKTPFYRENGIIDRILWPQSFFERDTYRTVRGEENTLSIYDIWYIFMDLHRFLTRDRFMFDSFSEIYYIRTIGPNDFVLDLHMPFTLRFVNCSSFIFTFILNDTLTLTAQLSNDCVDWNMIDAGFTISIPFRIDYYDRGIIPHILFRANKPLVVAEKRGRSFIVVQSIAMGNFYINENFGIWCNNFIIKKFFSDVKPFNFINETLASSKFFWSFLLFIIEKTLVAKLHSDGHTLDLMKFYTPYNIPPDVTFPYKLPNIDYHFEIFEMLSTNINQDSVHSNYNNNIYSNHTYDITKIDDISDNSNIDELTNDTCSYFNQDSYFNDLRNENLFLNLNVALDENYVYTFNYIAEHKLNCTKYLNINHRERFIQLIDKLVTDKNSPLHKLNVRQKSFTKISEFDSGISIIQNFAYNDLLKYFEFFNVKKNINKTRCYQFISWIIGIPISYIKFGFNLTKNFIVRSYNNTTNYMMGPYNNTRNCMVGSYNNIKNFILDFYNTIMNYIIRSYNNTMNYVKARMSSHPV